MQKLAESYRQRFASPDAAAEYHGRYQAGTYDHTVWEIEQQQLLDIIEQFVPDHAHVDYLDFACGSGRVLSFVAPRFRSGTGIEISEHMADIARSNSPTSEVDCVDITDGNYRPRKNFGFVTAFRFILNAEPDLRLAGLKALRETAGDGAVFVINNHANLWSHKAALAGFHKAKTARKGWTPMYNYLTERQVKELFATVGFEILHRQGAGLMGEKLARRVAPATVAKLERKFAKSRWTRFGSNQMYVLRRVAPAIEASGS